MKLLTSALTISYTQTKKTTQNYANQLEFDLKTFEFVVSVNDLSSVTGLISQAHNT